jgi:hypothetical protein
MAPKIIISFDGTDNDYDALALGRLFAQAGASVSIAYVRHTHESRRHREEFAHEEAEKLLERGARWLGQPDAERHIVLSPSTSEGLGALAEREGAEVIVFGSEYRTAPGHIDPQVSTRRLLEGGHVAIAIAPARLRERTDARLARIGMLYDGDLDNAVSETAQALTGGAVPARGEDGFDLLIVGSRPEATEGVVSISSANARRLEDATSPVLVLPRGRAVEFEAPVTA